MIPKDDIKIARLGYSQLDDVIRIHMECFSQFFLTSFGPSFLKVFYRGILNQHDHIAKIAVSEDGRLVGFVVGVSDEKQIYMRLLRANFASLTFRALPTLASRPSLVPRLLLSFLSRTKTAETNGKQALLMSLAVSPQYASRGIGKRLVNAFIGEAKNADSLAITLSTDKASNSRANRFYKSLGFHVLEIEAIGKRKMNRYIRRVC